MIVLSREDFDAIERHARENLPNEDCGLLGGTIDGDERTVKKIYFLRNLDASPEHFSMDAKEQFAAVKDMRANGLKLIGNFHSHPETPARPSDEDKRLVFDRNLSYLILSLAAEPTLKSFRYDADKNVFPEEIIAPELAAKFERLKEYLRELGSVAVAFSGGVDSTFLLKVARDVLGEKAVAITSASDLFPQREFDEAKNFCAAANVRQITFFVDELKIDGFKNNPPNRCYLCKKNIFAKIKELAAENNLNAVAEGSNMDDTGDYRPGLKAIDELGIKSPLRVAGLYKSEIRALSRALNLPTAEKPSMACLASRFVYGETISPERLAMVERAEEFLRDKNFRQFRVRVHGTLARIEILPEDFGKVADIRGELTEHFKTLGFDYVTLDLQGYRTGSMNLNLESGEKK